jgi:hypothetical protein
MKHTLRWHDFGWGAPADTRAAEFGSGSGCAMGQNRASPQGVAAKIAASFVARLANIANIGCASLRAIDNFGSHRTRVSLC